MRALPQDNLSYPVLIEINSGSLGSGCIINSPEGSYLATAKHVFYDENNNLIGDTATLTSYTPELKANDFTKITLDLNTINQNTNIKHHGTQDVCLVRVLDTDSQKKTTASIGVTLNMTSTSGVCGININTTVRLFDDTLISNDVFIFGYPASIGIKNSPQFNASMPLLRKGIIAGKDSANRTIILDCPVYKGNSGGPVIEVENNHGGIRYRLIGLVSQFVPVEEHWKHLSYGMINTQWSNSGYSIVVPVDSINELIAQF